jgi:hypothetical protein|tara:strand:- start:2092 stop:2337 length:246 start_codon:yes stop_codon:yes gene_type:complete
LISLFSLEKIVLQTIQEAQETNKMIKIQSFKLLDKYQEEKTQEIENIIRNNNQVILKLDLIITELKKEKLENSLKKLVEDF